MTEDEYVRATNLAKLRMVNSILRDILSGDRFGISDNDRTKLIYLTSDIIDDFGEIEITDETTCQELLTALEAVKQSVDLCDAWWIDCPDKGGIDMDLVEGAIGKGRLACPKT